MNALLKQAIAAIEALPEEDQKEVAEGLIGYAELIRSGHPLLTTEQRDGVEEARREAKAGLFATKEEMAETWRKLGQ